MYPTYFLRLITTVELIYYMDSKISSLGIESIKDTFNPLISTLNILSV